MEGVEEWLWSLRQHGLLFHMDDSPRDIHWGGEYTPSNVQLAALEDSRLRVLEVCEKAGIDVFTLYPVQDMPMFEPVKSLAETWENHFNTTGEHHPNAITLTFEEDVDIVNPWMSPCGRFAVEPRECYGLAFYDWFQKVETIAEEIE